MKIRLSSLSVFIFSIFSLSISYAGTNPYPEYTNTCHVSWAMSDCNGNIECYGHSINYPSKDSHPESCFKKAYEAMLKDSCPEGIPCTNGSGTYQGVYTPILADVSGRVVPGKPYICEGRYTISDGLNRISPCQ